MNKHIKCRHMYMYLSHSRAMKALWRMIWVCTACLLSNKKDARLIWVTFCNRFKSLVKLMSLPWNRVLLVLYIVYRFNVLIKVYLLLTPLLICVIIWALLMARPISFKGTTKINISVHSSKYRNNFYGKSCRVLKGYATTDIKGTWGSISQKK